MPDAYVEAVYIQTAAKLIRVPAVLHASTYKNDLALSLSWLVIANVLFTHSLKTILSIRRIIGHPANSRCGICHTSRLNPLRVVISRRYQGSSSWSA
jgi:hypothetical protein